MKMKIFAILIFAAVFAQAARSMQLEQAILQVLADELAREDQGPDDAAIEYYHKPRGPYSGKETANTQEIAEKLTIGEDNDRDDATIENWPGQSETANTQLQAIRISGCGAAGHIIQAALRPLGLFFFSGGSITVNCGRSCTEIIIRGRPGIVQTHVRVCRHGGSFCVETITACRPRLHLVNIPIHILVGGVPLSVFIRTDFPFGHCSEVQVRYPRCPAQVV